jgi:hypothetical protein
MRGAGSKATHNATVDALSITTNLGDHSLNALRAHLEQLIEVTARREIRDVRLRDDVLEPHIGIDQQLLMAPEYSVKSLHPIKHTKSMEKRQQHLCPHSVRSPLLKDPERARACESVRPRLREAPSRLGVIEVQVGLVCSGAVCVETWATGGTRGGEVCVCMCVCVCGGYSGAPLYMCITCGT